MERRLGESDAVFRGTVLRTVAYEDPDDGHIHTRAWVRVEEVFKGILPAAVTLTHRGGTVGDRGEMDGCGPRFAEGEERLLFVTRGVDGRLRATRGSAGAVLLPAKMRVAGSTDPDPTAPGRALLGELRSLTILGPLAGADLADQIASVEAASGGGPRSPKSGGSTTNLMADAEGIPARFVLPDRGDPIPYLVDADALPDGISQARAMEAVSQALEAWTRVTCLKFAFAGMRSFGMAAGNIKASDGILRIQLHDRYNYTGGGLELGRGGLSWTSRAVGGGWTTGGSVAGNSFHRVTSGFVVLQHTSSAMRNLSTFTEVLTHEVGHAIGMGHSSENQNEANGLLKQSVMYYLAHEDNRGAALNGHDVGVAQQAYPKAGPPPYCFDRVLEVVTSPKPITASGVNAVEVRGYSLASGALTLQTADATAINGTFAAADGIISYQPKGFFADSERLEPGGTAYFDLIYARYSDGVNASPYASVRVISLNADAYSEGIPDSWRQARFGSANPAAGPNRRAGDDFDQDGFTNLQEYRLGSDPVDRNSNLRLATVPPNMLQWPAKPYELYEVYGSTDLKTWSRAMTPVVPTNGTAAVVMPEGMGARFFKVEKVQ
jgi:hypothetical protein